MELERAQSIADEVMKRLSPYCQRIAVAGSVRRQKLFPHDIDIVLMPSDPWNLDGEFSVFISLLYLNKVLHCAPDPSYRASWCQFNFLRSLFWSLFSS